MFLRILNIRRRKLLRRLFLGSLTILFVGAIAFGITNSFYQNLNTAQAATPITVSPNNGSVLGNDNVTITGTGFDNTKFTSAISTSGGGSETLSVVPDNQGNVLLYGSFSGIASYETETFISNGGTDAVLIKVDKNGDVLWSQTWGGAGNDTITAIVSDSKKQVQSTPDIYNIYVVGDFEDTVNFGAETYTSEGGTDNFVSQLDASGNMNWTDRVSSSTATTSSGERISGIDIDSAGYIYIQGMYEGNANFYHQNTSDFSVNANGSGSDGYVAKLNEYGNWQFVKSFGGNNVDDVSGGISVDQVGNTLSVTGSIQGTAQFDALSYTAIGESDIYVANLSLQGDWNWVTGTGGISSDYGFDVKISSLGETFVSGSFRSQSIDFGSTTLGTQTGDTDANDYDGFLARVDTTGNWVWAQQFGNNSNDTRSSYLWIDETHSQILLNHTFSTSSTFGSNTYTSLGQKDNVITYTNYAGNTFFSKQYGSTGDDFAGTIITDEFGNIYTTSSVSSAGTFDTLTPPFSGGIDSVFAKIGGIQVTFDGVASPNVWYINSTSVIAQTPPHSSGNVNVVVTSSDGISGTLSNSFAYRNSALTSVNPTFGSISGGTNITINGSGFTSKFTKIVGGDGFSVGLKNDGTVWAWGDNYNGQLGNGSYGNSLVPVQVAGLSGITSIASSGYHSLALKNDGTVWAWGYNYYGELGNNTQINSNIPIQVNSLTGISAIQTGYYHSLALKNDGTVFAWGYNVNGQIGIGNTQNQPLPIQVANLSGITSIASSGYHSLALKNDGTVWAWGLADAGQLGDPTGYNYEPIEVLGVNNVTSIATGDRHSLALKNDGTLWAWGSNSTGQLGNGTADGNSNTVPTEVSGISNVSTIAATYDSSFILKNDGTVWAWGSNSDGLLGDGTGVDSYVPIQPIGATNVTSLSVGYGHPFLFKSNNTVLAWGWNYTGQLGDGTTNSALSPIVTLLPQVSIDGNSCTNTTVFSNTQISCTTPAGTAGAKDISVYVEGYYTGNLSSAFTYNAPFALTSVTPNNGSTAGGTSITLNGSGFLNTPSHLQISIGGSNCTSINVVSSTQVTCVTPSAGITGAKDVVVTNGDGQIATLTGGYTYTGSICSITPLSPSSGSTLGGTNVTLTGSGFVNQFTKVAGGYGHSLALKDDGTVWSWGMNNKGQLGDGTTTQRLTPVQVSGLSGITSIAANTYQSFALKNDGTVWAWGDNGYGQLGDGTTTDRLTPVQVSGLSGITSINAGTFHSLALKNDGTVWAWGDNGYGQLGDGTTTQQLTPVQVSGLSGVTNIHTGYNNSFASKSDGTTWAWGWNNSGQLGDGTTTTTSTAVQVSNISNITSITGGYGYSIALKNDGTVWSWGENSVGQLGDGTTTNRSTAVQVLGLSSVTSIATGVYYSIALKNDGTTWTWGLNFAGQLGDGTTTDRSTPMQVSSISGVTTIAAGFYHSLVIKSDGIAWSWGQNSYGQIGDGTSSVDRLTATQVVFPLAIVIDGNGATNIVIVSDTQITFTTPPGTPGTKNLLIDGLPCGDLVTLTNSYTYIDPQITNSNITSMVCDTPRYVGETTSCVLTVDTNFSNYTGSVNVKVDAAGTAVNCPIPGSGTTMTCSTIPLPSTVGSYQSQFSASGSGSSWANGNTVNVIENVVRSNLSLYYDANHVGSYPGSGQTITDLSGSGKNGFLGFNNTSESADPTFNSTAAKSFTFDGVNDVIDTTLPSNFSSSFTAEAWVKAYDDSDTGVYSKRIINLYSTTDRNESSMFINISGRTFTVFGRRAGDNAVIGGYSNFKLLTQWQHVAVTYNATNFTNNIYVNGVLQSTFVLERKAGVISNMTIGSQIGGGVFTGDISVVRMYSTDLSKTQVTQNFDVQKSRFGFTNQAVSVVNSPSISVPVTSSASDQTVTVNLASVTITDRRKQFKPWAVQLQLDGNLVSGSNNIDASKVQINNGALGYTMGSALYTSAGATASYLSHSQYLNLVTNTAANGGGIFSLTPTLTITVPANTPTGTYTATITARVYGASDTAPNEVSASSSLVLWLDAGKGFEKDSNGNVSQLLDMSGNGKNLTQATSTSRPALNENAQNNLPTLQFDGVDDTLVSGAFQNAANVSLFSVATNTRAAISTTVPHNIDVIGTFSTTLTSAPGLSTSSGYASTGNERNLNAANGSAELKKNGATTPLAMNQNEYAVTSGIFTGATQGSSFRLGTYNDGVFFGKNNVSEFVAYNAALSSTDQKSLQCYLSNKYNLSSQDCSLQLSNNFIPAATISNKNIWSVNAADITLSSPINLKRENGTTNLVAGTSCQNQLIINGGTQKVYTSTLDSNSQCITSVPAADISEKGTAVFKTRVTVNSISYDTAPQSVQIIDKVEAVSDGLALYYDAGRSESYSGTGQTVTDLSGNGRNGTLGADLVSTVDDPTFNSAGIKSFVLDGADDNIQTSLASNFSNSITQEVWFKRNSSTASVSERLIVQYGNPGTTTRLTMATGGTSTFAAASRRLSDSSIVTYQSGFFPGTQWEQGVLSYDNTTQTLSLYVNGVLCATATEVLIPPNSLNMAIGILAPSVSGFPGEIGLVRVYNRGLSQAEVTQNFNANKEQFGFINQGIVNDVPLSTSFVVTTSSTAQTLTATLPQITFTDRRKWFKPWSAQLSVSNALSGINTISANNITLNPGTITQNTGSMVGMNQQNSSSFITHSHYQNIVSNTQINGGGIWKLTPSFTVVVPPNTPSGTYTINLTTRTYGDLQYTKPTELDNQKAWFDASSGITKDGSNFVTAWTNRMLNATSNGSASGITSPLFLAAGLNGQNSLDFNGDRNHIDFQLNNNFSQGITILAASEPDVINNPNGHTFGGPPSNSQTIVSRPAGFSDELSLINTGKIRSAFNIGGNLTTLQSNKTYTAPTKMLTTVQYDNSQIRLYLDGTLDNSLSVSGGLPNTQPDWDIGERNTEGQFDGQIPEVAIFGDSLTNSERQELECYLSSKYDFGIKNCAPTTEKIALTNSFISSPSVLSTSIAQVGQSGITITSPVNQTRAATSQLLPVGTPCNNYLVLNYGTKKTYSSTLNASAQCVTTIPATDILAEGSAAVWSEIIVAGVSYENTPVNLTLIKENIVSSGLALYYDAQKTASYSGFGQTVFDLSGNQKDGVLGTNNTVESTDATFESTGTKSFRFDGVNDAITTSLASNALTDSTMEVWFKRANNNNPVINHSQRLITMLGVPTGSRNSLVIAANNAVEGVSRTQADVNVFSILNTGFVPNTQWQQAVVTYNNTTFERKVYVNGILHSTGNTQISNPSTDLIKIGALNFDGLDEFAGDISNVKVYSRPLSQSEVTQNFNANKEQFGFTNTEITNNAPSTVSVPVTSSTSDQTLTLDLPQITFTDRRSEFVPWASQLQLNGNLSSGVNVIDAKNISIENLSYTVTTGSGIYNAVGSASSYLSHSHFQNVLVNSQNNGGGDFNVTPRLTINVPAGTPSGTYSSTISFRNYGSNISKPNQISGLSWWLDATKGVELDTTGTVKTWRDQSGNGKDAQMLNSTEQPAYKPISVNNQPTVDFDGVNDSLSLPSSVTHSSQFTRFVIAKTDTLTGSRMIYGRNINGSHKFGFVEGTMFTRIVSSGSSEVAYPFAAGQFGLTSIQRDENNKIDVTVNAATPTRLFSNAAQTGDNITEVIGKGDLGAGQFWDGEIAEIISFNRKLTDNERKEVECYLSVKYNLNFSSCADEKNILLSNFFIPGAVTTSESPIRVGNSGVQIISPISLKKANGTTNLDTGTICENQLILNGGTQKRYSGTLNSSAQCTTTITPSDIPIGGQVVLKTRVTLYGVAYETNPISVPVTQDIVTNGLQAYYDANNIFSYPGSGQQVFDLSGNNRNGTFGTSTSAESADPTFNSTGIKSFVFDGVNDYLLTGLQANFSDSFTAEVWFKRSDNSDVVSQPQRILYAENGTNILTRFSLDIEGKTIQANYRRTGDGQRRIMNTSFVSNTEWQLATLTYDNATQTGKVYINGVLHSTFNEGILPGYTSKIRLGGSDRPFYGEVATSRLYSRPLTNAEVTYNFLSEKNNFGISQSSVLPTIPATLLSFTSTTVPQSTQTVSTTLNDVSILDRRGDVTGVPWVATVSASNLVNGSYSIPASSIFISPNSQSLLMGSGYNQTVGSSGYFLNSSTPRTLINNTGANGGGQFNFSPTISIDIPPYLRAGTYTGTLVISTS